MQRLLLTTKTVSGPFIIRYWWNLVRRLNGTRWIQKTQNRKCAAIFQDGRRHFLENHWNALNQPFIAGFCWNLVHRLNETYWIQKTQNRKCAAIFQDGRRRYPENLWNGLIQPFIVRFWWNLVHRLMKTRCIQKERKSGSVLPLFSKMIAATILTSIDML